MSLLGGAAAGVGVKLLKNLAAKHGLPILKRVLKGKGGVAGSVAADAIDAAAEALNVEATPAAIDQTYAQQPGRVVDALRKFEADNQDYLLAAIEAGARLVENDQMSEDRYRSRVRPTVIYAFVLILLWVVGLASFAPNVARGVVAALTDLPAEFWWVIGSAVGLYTAARTADKAVKNVMGGKI